MAFTIGENVGPYRIISQLGQGGMATVYKAYHASLDRYVAIKVLHAAFKEDPTFTARFAREARVLAKLEHPNIVPIYDFAEQNGDPYLVMKYVEGDTLKARMAQGVLPMEEVLKVVDAVGAGLSYAHKQGILHRDIKPSNVIITNDGQYYLSDFGLARIASAGESTLSQDTMLGTPNYISPEQAKGVRDLDARTDIYSFGVLLYEMVVGRVPFSGDTPFAIIHDHIYTPLPLPSKVNPNVPESVELVLLKALSKDREDRYAEASVMMAAFKQAIQETNTMALAKMQQAASASVALPLPADASTKVGAASAVAATAKPKTNVWKWVAIGGGVVVLLLVLVIGFVVVRNMNNRPQQGGGGGRGTQVALGTPLPGGGGNPPIQGTGQPPQQPSGQPLIQQTSPFLPTAIAFVTANPNNIEALQRLAQSQFESGMPDEAVKTYTKAAELTRNDEKIYLEGARVMSRDPIASLKLLANGIEKNPNSKDLQEAIATNLVTAASRPEAIPVLQEYVTRFPNSPVPRAALAMDYLFNRQPDRARPVVDEMVAKFPNDPYTYFVSGMMAVANNQRDVALREYEKVLADRTANETLKRRAQEQINILKGTPAPLPQGGQPGSGPLPGGQPGQPGQPPLGTPRP